MPRAFEPLLTTSTNTVRALSGPFESSVKHDDAKPPTNVQKAGHAHHTAHDASAATTTGVRPDVSTASLPPPGTQEYIYERDDDAMRVNYERSRYNRGQYQIDDDLVAHHCKKTQKDVKPTPAVPKGDTMTPPPLPLWGVVRHIPNAVTVAGLFCGLLALRECALGRGGNCATAAWLIMQCYYMDVLDGGLARVLHATSPIGATLDDIADFVCHGVAPIGLLICMNTPHSDTITGKMSEASWPVLGLCATLGFLAMCRTTHLYTTKSTVGPNTYYHGLPTTYVGPGIATMYVLTESPTIATWAAVGLTILLLPIQTRVAEGMLESQAWKRWAFLTSLVLSLSGLWIGALATLAMLSLYTFYPKCFEWDQRYPTRLTGKGATKWATGSLWRRLCATIADVSGRIGKAIGPQKIKKNC